MHARREVYKSQFIPLRDYCYDLFAKAQKPDADIHYKWAAHLLDELISTTKDKTVLHGDLHHANIMHSSQYGWIIIDPKGIYGDPHYDLACCFNNPGGHEDLTRDPERIQRVAQIFSNELGYDKNDSFNLHV